MKRLLDAATGVLLAVLAFYLAQSAVEPMLEPGFRARLLAPQERSCVIREDVCAIVGRLRREGAGAFELSPELSGEAFQRIGELAYPIRLQPGADLRVDLCHRQRGGESVALRVADVKRATEKDSDICLFARR